MKDGHTHTAGFTFCTALSQGHGAGHKGKKGEVCNELNHPKENQNSFILLLAEFSTVTDRTGAGQSHLQRVE